ncbi:O-antigen/teichoic acid export membrane protein [Methanococcus voltae]|uniref:O-antigen/teichoic acid export membrane protein n=1 Tax=Methanococcus voltae TaxID=2188 RepID=A0A8J7RDU7_METVO|nr:flippase [Methanococcus voltae]MBP2201437.1 O-antigen/teichoic acid export membrane protein [Methanococcus voltae]
MSYKQRAVRGIGWNFLLTMLTGPISYGVRMIYANYLPKTEVGLFYAILDLLCILAIFRGLGSACSLSILIPKYAAERDYVSIKSATNFALMFHILIEFIMIPGLVLLSPYIVNDYLNSTGQYTGNLALVSQAFIIVLIGYFLFEDLLGILNNLLRGFQNQKYLATITPFKSVIILMTSIILLLFGLNDFRVPIIAYSLAPIIAVVLYGSIVFKKVYPDYFNTKSKISKEISKKMLNFGIPITMNSATSVLLTYIDGVFLTIFTGLIAVAEYRNVAAPTITLLNIAVGSISIVLLPMVSELWTLGKVRELTLGITNIFKYLMALTIPLIICLAYYVPEFITVFFNSSYLPVTDAVRVLMVSVIFSSLYIINSTVLSGVGKPHIATKFLYMGIFVNILLNFLLIPKFGSLGAATTTLISYIIIHILLSRYLKKSMNLEIKYKETFKILVVGFLSLIPPALITNLFDGDLIRLVLGFVVYTICYVVMIFRLKVIAIDEILSLVKK